MFCSKCGNQLSEVVKFCNKCGTQQSTGESTPKNTMPSKHFNSDVTNPNAGPAKSFDDWLTSIGIKILGMTGKLFQTTPGSKMIMIIGVLNVIIGSFGSLGILVFILLLTIQDQLPFKIESNFNLVLIFIAIVFMLFTGIVGIKEHQNPEKAKFLQKIGWLNMLIHIFCCISSMIVSDFGVLNFLFVALWVCLHFIYILGAVKNIES